jgi:hypothetical protein
MIIMTVIAACPVVDACAEGRKEKARHPHGSVP